MQFNQLPVLSMRMRLLLPLSVLLLGMGLLLSWQLWQSVSGQAQAHTVAVAQDFSTLNGPRIAELSARGKPAELKALLEQQLLEHPEITSLQWHSTAGPAVQVQSKAAATVLASAQRLAPVQQRVELSWQNQPAGTLDLTLSPTLELNRVWPALRQQLWSTTGLLLLVLLLMAWQVHSSLRALLQLNRAVKQLPSKPELRIRPTGTQEVRHLTQAFNTMASALHRARKTANEQLEKTARLANLDALTGLPNSTLLADRIRQGLYRCERHQEMLGLCQIDLDHFKAINDQHGQAVGDEVLNTLAQRMQTELRDTDTLARIGGDEFVVLLSSLASEQAALGVIARVLSSVRQPIELNNGLVVQLSASAGLTTQAAQDADHPLLDADHLLRQADQAMYLAKQAGRDQILVWNDTTTPAHTEAQQQWIDQLTHAVHAGELRLHYQPKVHIRTGRLVGLEALIRWQHPTRGLLMPGEFLPFVENSPVIILMGQWVLAEALRQIERWQQDATGWPVSINVAASQFARADFQDELRAALQRHPMVPTKWLTLEILETSSLEDLTQVRATIDAVQALGVHCSLDDFGTGYSSLSYLKQLPVHEVKIDQGFVRGMLDDNGDLALVEGIITLAKVFSRRLVAEGVETPEHGVMLHRMGCSVAQGWAIAKAMPPEQVAQWEQQYQSDPMWALWSKSRWDLSLYPLMVAGLDHRNWLEQVLSMLNGEATALSADGEQNYRNSRFGGWYQRVGEPNYGHITGFHEIDQLHRRIHLLGAEVVRHCQGGEFEQAQPLAADLRKQSPRLIRGIELLHQQVLTIPVSVDTNF